MEERRKDDAQVSTFRTCEWRKRCTVEVRNAEKVVYSEKIMVCCVVSTCWGADACVISKWKYLEGRLHGSGE